MDASGKCCEIESETAITGRDGLSDSERDLEETGDECGLAQNVVLLNRPPSRVKRPEALHGSNPSFDRSMVLLNDVVEISDRSTMTTPTEFSTTLEFVDCSGIRGIAIYLDDSWTRMVW